MSRQNFYKARRKRQRKDVDALIICDMVMEERRYQPRLGGRKLFSLLSPGLVELGMEVGRDRFFEVLRNNGLLVDPLPRAPRTTMSDHSLPVFPNLIRDLEAAYPNHIWVCDITYVRLLDGFAYLALLTDVYSRKIVGYHLGTSLKTEEALKALNRALATTTDGPKPIHHSDRGCQYCSHTYVEALQAHGLRVSMTEVNHCAENALAERMNGILKQEYGLRNEFRNMEEARHFVDQAVDLYNRRRPHSSLKMRTPESVYSKAA